MKMGHVQDSKPLSTFTVLKSTHYKKLAPIAFRQSLCGGRSDVSDEVLFIYKVNGLGLDKNDRLHTCLHTCEERT